MQTNRRDDIREMVHHYLDTLLDLHDRTDPIHGEDGEIEKLYYARRAYEIWWYLHDKLMLWAQSHILAFHMLRDHQNILELYEKSTGENLHQDSHDLEFLGSHYSYNAPNSDHEIYIKTGKFLEQNNFDLADMTLRNFLSDILSSRSANSSFWRFAIQPALCALNEGEAISPLVPEPLKRQGQAYSLKVWKLECIKNIYFELGSGIKKYVSLQKASKCIGASVETIRGWEKELKMDDRAVFDMDCSYLAGKLSVMSKEEFEEAKNDEEYKDIYGLMTYIEMAEHILKRETKKSYEEIAEKIKKYRLKPSSGETSG